MKKNFEKTMRFDCAKIVAQTRAYNDKIHEARRSTPRLAEIIADIVAA